MAPSGLTRSSSDLQHTSRWSRRVSRSVTPSAELTRSSSLPVKASRSSASVEKSESNASVEASRSSSTTGRFNSMATTAKISSIVSFRGATRSSSNSTAMKGVRSATTVRCTTFTDPTLRRGMQVSRVLKRFGTILENRAGSAHTFAMSSPVPCLGVFISHNWSTKRKHKFLVLALHFNLQNALLMTSVTVALTGALCSFGVLPVMEASALRTYPVTAAYNIVLCFVVPMGTLLFGDGVMALLGRIGVREPRVFLDKACIHQTDPVLQRQGIECLSAYLNVADEMLIVYTSTYLKKLWTVYELASMLMIKDMPRITIVSTHLTQLLYVTWTLLFVFLLTQVSLGTQAVGGLLSEELGRLLENITWYGFMLPSTGVFLMYLRKWARERQSMHVAARAFRIRSTVCFVDADRKVVQWNVSCFMRDFGFVAQTATKDEALDAFDLTAQKLVPLFLDASFGTVGFKYSHAVAMMLPWTGWGMDVIFANVRTGYPPTWYVAHFIYYSGITCVNAPFWLAAAMFATSRCIELRGVREAAYIAILSILLVALAGLIDTIFLMLYYMGEKSWLGMLPITFATAALGAVNAWLYWPKPVHTSARESCKTGAELPQWCRIVHDEI